MVRDTARAYCQDKLAPRVLEMFRHEKTDPSIFREMGALDLLGIVIPEEYGGAGLNYVSYGLVAREVERVDSGFRSMMSVQGSLVMVPINEFGTEAQKQKFLPKLATGEWIGCFGLTEPGHGSDPGGMTSAREESATAASRSPAPSRGSATARSPTCSSSGRKTMADEIRGFILEKGMKGLSAPPIHGKVGLRTSVTGEIVMDNVFCPDENVVSGGARAEGPVHVLEQRALRHLLGRAGRGGRLLAPRAQLRARAQAVRPAARGEPADPEEARRHADRDRARPAGGVCGSAA